MDVTRYCCRYTGRICEFATEFGYCKVTACARRLRVIKGVIL